MELLFGLAIIYGTGVLVYLFIRNRKIRAALETASLVEALDDPFFKTAAEGRHRAQTAPYILHIIALVGLAGGLLGLTPFLYTNTSILFALLLWWFIIIPLTPVIAVVDAYWIYPKRFAEAEQFALMKKLASPRLKRQIIVAWVTWVVYIVTAVAFIVWFSNHSLI